MREHDVRATLRSLFPPGDEDLYAWDNPQSWVARELEAITTAVRLKGTDAVDQLRQEVRPHTATEKLADWERIFAMSKTSTALYGSLAARRAHVVARWREHGASTKDHIQAAFVAVLGYAPEVIEHSRAALRVLHSYITPGTPIGVAGNADTTATFAVADNAPVSQAGAQVTVVLTMPTLEDLDVRLEAPDGTTKTWTRPFGAGAAISATFVLYASEFAGKQADGLWSLVVTNNNANLGTIHTGTVLFVEGIGRGNDGSEGLGANIFEWSVLVDETQLGPTADLDAARALVARWNPAHARGYFCRYASAAGGGGASGVFDDPNALFSECLFG